MKPEAEIQTKLVTYLTIQHPRILFTISPAGFIQSAGMAKRSKAMGYRKGTPDLLFFEPRAWFHGLLVELKAGTQPSDEQRAFIRQAVDRGYATAVCYSYEEARDTIENYLGLKGTL
jgi:hypothetical protein